MVKNERRKRSPDAPLFTSRDPRRAVNWTIVLASLIATIPPTVASIAAVVVSVANGKKVDEVHVLANDLSTKLVATTKAEALKSGHSEGVKDEKMRQLLEDEPRKR